MISKLVGLGAHAAAGHRAAPAGARRLPRARHRHEHPLPAGGPRPPRLPRRRLRHRVLRRPSRRSSSRRPIRRSSRWPSWPPRWPPTGATTTGPRSSPPGPTRPNPAWVPHGPAARAAEGRAVTAVTYVALLDGGQREEHAARGADRAGDLRGDPARRDPPRRRLPPRPRHHLAPGGRGELLGAARRARQRDARAPARLGLPARDPRRAARAHAPVPGEAHRRRAAAAPARRCPARWPASCRGPARRSGRARACSWSRRWEWRTRSRSPKDGKVVEIAVGVGQSVEGGATLASR